jgi:hypothetical protein
MTDNQMITKQVLGRKMLIGSHFFSYTKIQHFSRRTVIITSTSWVVGREMVDRKNGLIF